jgi:hypothetical protein
VAGDVAPGKEEICERRRTRVCGGDEGGVCERSKAVFVWASASAFGSKKRKPKQTAPN